MFVGGCVRNYILDQEIDDIDIATVLTPTEVKEKFKETKIKVLETGIDHGSLTLLLNNSKFEITTLRRDTHTDGRHAKISFTDDWKEDSERRDFTINAIYLDRKGNIFDPQLGVKDLKNQTVKFIGDPSKRIEEDYLRILRFVRFALKYCHKTFEPSTIEAIKLNLNGIKNISKERILQELLKIIALENFKDILNKNELKDIFSQIFPEFKNLTRIKKAVFFPKKEFGKINTNLILAVMLFR
jgi:tRNA nucleotidyltransferase/poly(A) polymerase